MDWFPSSFVFLFLALCIPSTECWNNGVARTPPMGWSTWNHFHRYINASLFYQTAQAMVDSGMAAAGYEYVNVDGGWWAGCDTGHIHRNSSGFFEVDKKKFPNGIEPIVKYLHSLGLKYGHYTDAGVSACNRDKPMSEYYEKQDVALFVSWGIDMLKLDACARQEGPEVVIKRWHDLFVKHGRTVLFSNCRNGCQTNRNGGWKSWCGAQTNMWRTSTDICSTWKCVMHNLDTLKGRGHVAKPGQWNDPDFLELDNGEFKYTGTQQNIDMNEAHFSMWCITSAPLIAGNDLRNMPKKIKDILTNKLAISINQQYNGDGGDLLTADGLAEVWYKPLPKNQAAVALLNRGPTGVAMNVSFSDLPVLQGKTTCTVENVWAATTTKTSKMFSQASVRPRQAVLAIIHSCM